MLALDKITIALVGPISTEPFLELLNIPVGMKYPKGLGGTPVNLLALELHRRGYNILLCSVDPHVDDDVVLQGERLKICYGKYRKRPARTFFSDEIRWMVGRLLKEKPTIVHAHWTYEFALAAEAAAFPCLVTAHDAPINVLKRNFIPYRVARTLMAYFAVLKAKNLSAVSPYVAGHLRRFLFYFKRIDVIPNGMPDDVFLRKKSKVLSGGVATFASVLTGWSGYKNSEAAIVAFSEYYKINPQSRLLMYGAGHGIGELAEQWAKEKGISLGIEFIGQITHEELINELIEKVDILIHPSLEEAQPMTLIECMALGIPVIGGKSSGGVPWTLAEGVAGVLVNVKRPKEISDAMQELVNNGEKRNQLIGNALVHVENTFHIKKIADAYVSQYERILNESIL